jgi:LPS export ABC transporter protein LptC
MGMRLIYFWMLLISSACGSDGVGRSLLFSEENTAIEVATGVEILYSDSGMVRVRVMGPVLHNYLDRDEPRQEFPEGIKIEFFRNDQSVGSEITAHRAVRVMDQGSISLRDSVRLVTVMGECLETQALNWDEKTGRIRTDKFVTVSRPGEILYGYGLEAAQDFSSWNIKVPKGRIKAGQLNDLE